MMWLSVFAYILAAFGICNMIAFGSGPFRIFERIRDWSASISEHFGLLFRCMMCLPANFGWIMSLIDWFLIPAIAFTPFNILFGGVSGLWWLAMILDCCFTSGIVWLLHQLDEWFEREPVVKKGDMDSDDVEYYDENGNPLSEEEALEILGKQERGNFPKAQYMEVSPILDKKTKKQLLMD
jgi:hypothetical protein